MEHKNLRTDEKIRTPFVVYSRPTRSQIGRRLVEGHIYEQRNVMLTKRDGEDVSEQFSSLDAMIQTMGDIYQIEFPKNKEQKQ